MSMTLLSMEHHCRTSNWDALASWRAAPCSRPACPLLQVGRCQLASHLCIWQITGAGTADAHSTQHFMQHSPGFRSACANHIMSTTNCLQALAQLCPACCCRSAVASVAYVLRHIPEQRWQELHAGVGDHYRCEWGLLASLLHCIPDISASCLAGSAGCTTPPHWW
jgi:hypothetical protein